MLWESSGVRLWGFCRCSLHSHSAAESWYIKMTLLILQLKYSYISYIWLWQFVHPALAHLRKIEKGDRYQKEADLIYLCFSMVYFQCFSWSLICYLYNLISLCYFIVTFIVAKIHRILKTKFSETNLHLTFYCHQVLHIKVLC